MAGKLNPFQMVGFSHWRGLTKSNHLGSIFQLAPQKASDLMVRLLGFQRGKTYGSYINSLPVKEFDTDAEYTWDAVASASRNIPLKEVRKSDGSAVSAGDIVGANGERFELVFGEDWFALGEVIIGAKNLYPARIVADPKLEGTDAVYCCEWMGGYNVDGVKADDVTLTAGERYSVEYAPVERELSRKITCLRPVVVILL